ncbi:hypothetical protein L6R52_00595 [Myxococcota bacterium]|nr:hypothetical protein [Myxococcota bacterium]
MTRGLERRCKDPPVSVSTAQQPEEYVHRAIEGADVAMLYASNVYAFLGEGLFVLLDALRATGTPIVLWSGWPDSHWPVACHEVRARADRVLTPAPVPMDELVESVGVTRAPRVVYAECQPSLDAVRAIAARKLRGVDVVAALKEAHARLEASRARG